MDRKLNSSCYMHEVRNNQRGREYLFTAPQSIMHVMHVQYVHSIAGAARSSPASQEERRSRSPIYACILCCISGAMRVCWVLYMLRFSVYRLLVGEEAGLIWAGGLSLSLLKKSLVFPASCAFWLCPHARWFVCSRVVAAATAIQYVCDYSQSLLCQCKGCAQRLVVFILSFV